MYGLRKTMCGYPTYSVTIFQASVKPRQVRNPGRSGAIAINTSGAESWEIMVITTNDASASDLLQENNIYTAF